MKDQPNKPNAHLNIYGRIAQTVARSKTRQWLPAQTPEMWTLLRTEYAAFLGCPIDEVCCWFEQIAPSERFEDPAMLDFAYANLGKDIEAYAADHPISRTSIHPDPYLP